MSKRRIEGPHLRKEDFNLSASGGPDDSTDPVVQASSSVMQGRKIAPLRRKGARAGSPGVKSPALPNVFGSMGQQQQLNPPVAAPASQAPQSNGFGAIAANGTGFNFNSGAAPASNPFSSAAPSPGINGTTNGGFGANGGFNFGAGQQQPQTTFGGFGQSTPAPAPAASTIFGNNTNDTSKTGFGGFGTQTSSTPTFGSGFGQQKPAEKPAPAPSTGFSSSFGQNASQSSFSGSQPTQSSFSGFGTQEKKPETPASSFGSDYGQEQPKTPSFGGFGQSQAQPPASTSTFGQKPATTFGGFGSGTPAPSQTPTPSFGTGFGANNNTTTTFNGFGQNAEKKEEPKQPSFGSFGGTPTPTSSFEKKDEPPAEAPKAGFQWGQTSTAEKKDTPAPSNGMFGAAANSTSTFGSAFGKKDETVKPSTNGDDAMEVSPQKKLAPAGSFGSGFTPSSTPMFGKPAEQKTTEEPPKGGLFDRISQPKFDAPASTTSSLFGKPAESNVFGTPVEKEKTPEAPSSFFPKPAEKDTTASAPMFGQPAENQAKVFGKPAEAPKPSTGFFGNAAEKKDDAPSSFFTPGPKKVDPPMFGSAPAKASFNPPASPFGSIAQKPAETSKAAGYPSGRTTPPLPTEASQWSSAQVTEYYNLWAVRSLNDSFKKQLQVVDVLQDYTPLCNTYTAEMGKVKACIDKGERYKVNAQETSSGLNKRSLEDGESSHLDKKAKGDDGFSRPAAPKPADKPATSMSWELDAKKPMASAPAYGFAPPSKTMETSSDKHPSLASTPAFGFKPPGAVVPAKDTGKAKSVFDSPNTQSVTSWKSPWQDHTPPPVIEEDEDADNEDDSQTQSASQTDDDDATPRASKTRALQGIFNSAPATNNTWSPDKGVRFSTPSAGSTLFGGAKSSSASTLFGNPIKAAGTAEKSNIFGSTNGSAVSSGASSPNPFAAKTDATTSLFKSAAPSSVPSSIATSAATSDSEAAAGGPSDTASDPQTDLTTGAGEEDENVLGVYRCKVYDFFSKKDTATNVGVGNLKVLSHKETKRGRVIVRKDNGGVIANFGLVKGSKVSLRGENVVVVMEFVEGGRKLWGLRVKTKELATEVKGVVERAMEGVD